MAPSDTSKLSYTVGGVYLGQSADQGRDGDQLSQSTTFDTAKASPSDVSRQYWTPVWLRRYTLIAFAALFAALAAALVVLWFTNKHQNGFSTTLGTNHYAWTYGPTAILVVVLSLWRQVEYHCKLLQPWQELRKGSAEAERSMLLDYLSPLQVTSFVRAIRYHHTPVAVSIAGFTMLKAIVLVSTGLLVLTPVKTTEPQLITVSTAFDSQPFWDTIPGAPYAWDRSGPDRVLYTNVSAHPVPSYLNTFREGAAPLANMAGSTVFQSIDPIQGNDPLSVAVDVDAFTPDMECEIAQADFSSRYASMKAQFKSATCSEPGGHILYDAYKLCEAECTDEISFNIWRVNCSQGPIADPSNMVPLRIVDEHTSDDMRFAMLVSDLAFERYHSTGANTSTKVTPKDTAAVICKADYKMYNSLVTQNLTGGMNQAITTEPMPHLSNLTGLMLGEIIWSALVNSKYLKGDLKGVENMPSSQDFSPRVAFYNIMLQTMEGEQSIDRLLSAQTLLSSAEQTMSGLAAHIIRESFLRPSISQQNGTVLRSEERLEIGTASLWVMVAGFVIMILLTSCVTYTTSQHLVARDPGLLSTDAIILASDPDLRKLLAPCSAMRTNEVADTLHGTKFGTLLSHDAVQIHFTRDPSGRVFDKPRSNSTAKAWEPLLAKHWVACITLLVPLVAIVGIEVADRVSKDNGGFLIQVGSEDRVTFLSRYLSALVVLLIATCYNSLDFTVASFAPYSSLRSGPVPASRSLDLRILGSTPPVALSRSVSGGHVGPSLSNIAGMIGSVLTIVASGLWVVNRNLAVEQPIVASLTNRWDYDWHDSYTSGDGGAAIILDQLQHGSAIMPESIWDNVVLPHIEDIRSTSSDTLLQSQADPQMQNHTLLVKGLRPQLSCEVLGNEHISISTTHHMQALAPLPPNCHYGGPNGSNSFYNFSLDLSSEYFGSLYDLHLSPSGNIDLLYDEYDMGTAQPDNPAGCPSVGAILAKTSLNDNGPDQVTVLMCSQLLQQVDVRATYFGSSLQHPNVSADPAPTLDESSIQHLTNGTVGVDTFPYRVKPYLQDNLTSFPQSRLGSVDKFTEHLVFGPNGTSLDDLIGTANEQNFMQAVQTLYARYMCLVIDMRFRVPVTAEMRADPQQESLLAEGTSYSFSSRLHLNTTSKLTLQIMLGAMFVLGTCTYLLTDLRGTLPREPYTIASRMAFLAGSDLCDGEQSHLPHDALWKSRKGLDQVLEGWLFSLGWWQQSNSSASEHAEATANKSDCDVVAEEMQRPRRFGIDVGVPEQLGFRETKWSTLRQRLGRRGE